MTAQLASKKRDRANARSPKIICRAGVRPFRRLRLTDDIAPALAAIAAGIADGVISVDEAAAAANVLQKFLDVLETAHRLSRGLSPWDDGRQ
jgi:glyoxylate carboligase